MSQRLLPRKDGKGLVPAFELMLATPAIRNLIREKKMHQARGIIEASRRDGMRTMDQALKDLYESGAVHYEDVLRYMHNPRAITPPTGPTGGQGATPSRSDGRRGKLTRG